MKMVISISRGHAKYNTKGYHGWAKPVERWFRTLEEHYCIDLPGYCSGDPNKRAENFMQQLAVQHKRGELLTLDELGDVFLNQIIPAYANRPHEGYKGQTPMERYMTLPKARNEDVDWRTLSIIKTEMATRAVTTRGITFEKVLYWHEELRHLANKKVIVRYNRGDTRSLTVCDMEGHFICEVEPKDYLRHVGEHESVVQQHRALQKRQEKEVRRTIQSYGIRLPGKRASGTMFYELVDETASGNLTDLGAVRAARSKDEVTKRRRARAAGADESTNRVSDMMIRLGTAAINGSK